MKIVSTLLFCTLLMTQSNSFAKEGSLKACPSSPNCVSSQASGSHAIAPFLLIQPSEENWQKVISALAEMARTKVIHADETRLHAEVTSLIFRFVDEIDFIFNKAEKRVDIRSASRIGYSDFGVNRQRLERLRQTLQSANVIQ
jgi:uncharacterized protein (DUF1499 family)